MLGASVVYLVAVVTRPGAMAEVSFRAVGCTIVPFARAFALLFLASPSEAYSAGLLSGGSLGGIIWLRPPSEGDKAPKLKLTIFDRVFRNNNLDRGAVQSPSRHLVGRLGAVLSLANL